MSYTENDTTRRQKVKNYVNESGENPRLRLGGYGTKVAAFAVFAAIAGGFRGCAENITDFREGGLTEVAKGNWNAFTGAFGTEDISLSAPDIDIDLSGQELRIGAGETTNEPATSGDCYVGETVVNNNDNPLAIIGRVTGNNSLSAEEDFYRNMSGEARDALNSFLASPDSIGKTVELEVC